MLYTVENEIQMLYSVENEIHMLYTVENGDTDAIYSREWDTGDDGDDKTNTM